ncbi:hypothetical protein AAZV13_03G105000 [Glycine max]
MKFYTILYLSLSSLFKLLPSLLRPHCQPYGNISYFFFHLEERITFSFILFNQFLWMDK